MSPRALAWQRSSPNELWSLKNKDIEKKILTMRATKAETGRTFMGELETKEMWSAWELLGAPGEVQASDPILLLQQDFGRDVSAPEPLL